MGTDALPTAYRPCVGMMVLNDAGKVLVGQRIDQRSEAWQMPQGGIDEGEELEQAVLRELREEIGTDQVEILACTKEWLHYDLPEALMAQFWGGRFRGQKQRWFLMRLKGDETLVNIQTEHPEFHAVDWVEPERLPELIVPFKRELYQRVVQEFAPYLSDTA